MPPFLKIKLVTIAWIMLGPFPVFWVYHLIAPEEVDFDKVEAFHRSTVLWAFIAFLLVAVYVGVSEVGLAHR